MKTKGIETRYRGFVFRSRVEARWAMFFDKLKLPWEYEPQCFELASGKYLPDFRVEYPHDGTVWFEIKADLNQVEHRDWQRMIELEHTHRLLLLDGPPDWRMYCRPSELVVIDDGIYVTKSFRHDRSGIALWSIDQRLTTGEHDAFFARDDSSLRGEEFDAAVGFVRGERFTESGHEPWRVEVGFKDRLKAFFSHFKFLQAHDMFGKPQPDAGGWTPMRCPFHKSDGFDADLRDPTPENAYLGKFRCRRCARAGIDNLFDWSTETAVLELESSQSRPVG